MRRACGRTDDALIGVGNLPAAEAAAKELPRVSLADALELTLLIARKEPRRHPRVAARWLLRYLEDCDEATIDEAALVAACLAALSGAGQDAAARTLRTMVRPRPREAIG